MNTIPVTEIDLRFVFRAQVYYPPAAQTIELRVVASVPAAARLVSANDNEGDNG